ncbi:hypothetical protein HQ865_14415 [Mucilaginibacter mali]|uniref:Outer membrane protein beta-barrel domain-containing protein n=1 Tax=Mucilaginibacter mali TaxID=2740462 RepID=A0A7D4QG83_9SPHI|nr:hypothetical protein [Mucilaginibacter mali]QKJ30892.1 hypothetical protein HQ865_14415 [Mucilaginibacter mali]
MKKIKLLSAAAFIVAAILSGLNAKAQAIKDGQWRLGIGLEVNKGLGDFGDATSIGIGITPRLQYGLSSDLAFTLTSGYYHFFGKTYTSSILTPFGTTTATVTGADVNLVPLKAGIKAFFTEGWYFGAEVGAAFSTAKNGKTLLDLSPALGYASGPWEVSGRYEHLSNDGSLGFVGLRVAYGFDL